MSAPTVVSSLVAGLLGKRNSATRLVAARRRIPVRPPRGRGPGV